MPDFKAVNIDKKRNQKNYKVVIKDIPLDEISLKDIRTIRNELKSRGVTNEFFTGGKNNLPKDEAIIRNIYLDSETIDLIKIGCELSDKTNMSSFIRYCVATVTNALIQQHDQLAFD